MAKRADFIIDEVRESTENEEFTEETGLTEEEILKFINQASYRLHSKVVAQHPGVFYEIEEVSLIKDQESYALDFKAYLSNKIVQVEFSPTGQLNDYYPLEPASWYNRDSGAQGDPCSYIRKSNKIYLLPTPDTSSGKVRITYIRRVKRIDKRRGEVKAVTLDPATSTITSLDINYVNGASIDNQELVKRTRFCVVDQYGVIKMENVQLSAVVSSTSFDAALSVDPSFTYNNGETIEVGDYVVSGEYCSSHLEWDEEVERFIQLYAEWKVLKRDSSVDSQEMVQELLEIQNDILDSYAEMDHDIRDIPEINNSYDDWF